MEFSNRLKQLMKDSYVSQETLAKAIGYTQRGASKWVTGQSEPTATAIVRCIKYFEVSTDYLLGLED